MNDGLSIPLGVIVTRARLQSRWQDFAWRPSGVVLGAPELAPGSLMWREGDAVHVFAGVALLTLHRDEVASYKANLQQDPPFIYVVLEADGDGSEEPPPLHILTAAPDEAEAYQEGDAGRVEGVAMPSPVRDLIAAFIAQHDREPEHRTGRKRQRRRGLPEIAVPAEARE